MRPPRDLDGQTIVDEPAGAGAAATTAPSSSSTSTGAASALASQIDRVRATEREEHMATVSRLRAASRIGLLLWPLFGVLDWITAAYIEPGTLGYFLSLRGVGLVIIFAAVALLFRDPPPGPRSLRLMDLFVFSSLCLLLALQSLRFHGIESPLFAGIILVMVARGATLAEPFSLGLLHYGVMALVFPAVWGLAAILSPAARAWFSSPRSVAVFALHNAFLGGACAILTAAGHEVHRLRRRVVEEHNIGRYRLLRRLGAGGMGEVWVAQHQGLKREVALKVLRRDLSPEALLRFEREVMVTAALTHPNTIRVMDYGITPEGVPYYAMELLSGSDLKVLVKREGPLDPERARFLIWQACASLAEAHRRQVVHRDIKPENLFVTTLGDQPDFVKVLDFGIVKRLSEQDEALTVAGGLAGTPQYMAPEAARGQPSDARADVYALGAVLYFLLCGRPPFEGPTGWAILSQHVADDPEPPSRWRGAALPADLEAVALRCLRKDPAERYADAAELMDALGI